MFKPSGSRCRRHVAKQHRYGVPWIVTRTPCSYFYLPSVARKVSKILGRLASTWPIRITYLVTADNQRRANLVASDLNTVFQPGQFDTTHGAGMAIVVLDADDESATINRERREVFGQVGVERGFPRWQLLLQVHPNVTRQSSLRQPPPRSQTKVVGLHRPLSGPR